MNTVKLYFVEKNFLGFPIGILSSDYEDYNKELRIVGNDFRMPKRIILDRSKHLFFRSTDEMEKHVYCKCGKMCGYNEQFNKLVQEQKSRELKLD